MSLLPEDRSSELRTLFFESAEELLQTINEAGLRLEQHPADEELLRSVRRAVHTLKGDSAACGFQKLSEISHELEDILTLQVGQTHGAKLAEVVLAAVDTFESMLAPIRNSLSRPRLLLCAPSSRACFRHPLLHNPRANPPTPKCPQLSVGASTNNS